MIKKILTTLAALMIFSCSSAKVDKNEFFYVFNESQDMDIEPALKNRKIENKTDICSDADYNINIEFQKISAKLFSSLDSKFGLISAPLMHNENFYFIDENFKVFKIANNKDKSWKLTHKYKGSKKFNKIANIIIEEDSIFVNDSTGRIAKINIETGEYIWKTDMKYQGYSQFEFDDKKLFLLTYSNILVCLDKATGKEIWIKKPLILERNVVGYNINKPILINENELKVLHPNGVIRYYKPANGKNIAKQNISPDSKRILGIDIVSNFTNDPVKLIENVDITSSRGSGISYFNKFNPKPIFNMPSFYAVTNFVYIDTFLFFINNKSELVAMYANNPALKWKISLSDIHFDKGKEYQNSKFNSQWNSLILVGNKLLAFHNYGLIFVHDINSGESLDVIKTNTIISKVEKKNCKILLLDSMGNINMLRL